MCYDECKGEPFIFLESHGGGEKAPAWRSHQAERQGMNRSFQGHKRGAVHYRERKQLEDSHKVLKCVGCSGYRKRLSIVKAKDSRREW